MVVGIKESKEVLEFGLALGKGLLLGLEDGKISLDDILGFYSALQKAPAAFSGIEMIPAELGDLDASEVDELLACGKEFLGELEDSQIKMKVEAVFAWVKATHSLYLALKA